MRQFTTGILLALALLPVVTDCASLKPYPSQAETCLKNLPAALLAAGSNALIDVANEAESKGIAPDSKEWESLALNAGLAVAGLAASDLPCLASHLLADLEGQQVAGPAAAKPCVLHLSHKQVEARHAAYLRALLKK